MATAQYEIIGGASHERFEKIEVSFDDNLICFVCGELAEVRGKLHPRQLRSLRLWARDPAAVRLLRYALIGISRKVPCDHGLTYVAIGACESHQAKMDHLVWLIERNKVFSSIDVNAARNYNPDPSSEAL